MPSPPARAPRRYAAPAAADVCSASPSRKTSPLFSRRLRRAARVSWTTVSKQTAFGCQSYGSTSSAVFCVVCGEDMENLAIARIFSEIADLLEIKSENPFKIRAYRNASETIAHATDKLAYLQRRAAARHSRHRQGSGVEDPRDCRDRRGALSPGSARAVSADDSRPAPPPGRRPQDSRAALYASSASRPSRSSRPRAATAACAS